MFFRQVTGSLTGVSEILILGPGPARHGVEQEPRRRKSLNRSEVESRAADKLPLPAFKAAVKAHCYL